MSQRRSWPRGTCNPIPGSLDKGEETLRRVPGISEDGVGDEYEEWLLGFYNKITSQLKVSLYNVSDTSEVGIIFEVMNDRGKPLSDLEKVKNYLLYVSSKLSIENHDLAERINKTWSNIFRRCNHWRSNE